MPFNACDFPTLGTEAIEDLNWLETLTKGLYARLHNKQAPVSATTWFEIEKTLVNCAFQG